MSPAAARRAGGSAAAALRMLRAWRAPPLARARAGAARGWARSAASEAAAESREDSRYRDTVLLPRSRFPSQLPGRLQPETELKTQQVRRGPGRGAGPRRGAGPPRAGRVCVRSCSPGRTSGQSGLSLARPSRLSFRKAQVLEVFVVWIVITLIQFVLEESIDYPGSIVLR